MKKDTQISKELPKFQRFRRITGYISVSVDFWNPYKRAELRNRVKHSLDNL